MISVVLALTTRRIAEIGLLLGLLGGVVVAWAALAVVRGSNDRERERTATLAGALLIAAAFALQLLAMVTGPKTKPAQPVTPPPAPASVASPTV